jgi:hypothetical protein
VIVVHQYEMSGIRLQLWRRRRRRLSRRVNTDVYVSSWGRSGRRPCLYSAANRTRWPPPPPPPPPRRKEGRKKGRDKQ